MASVVARSVAGRALTTTVEARGHEIVADEPVAAGGDDLGPGPYDLLLASLAACTVMTLELYAARKRWPLEGVEIRATHERRVAGEGDAAAPGERIDRITQEVRLDGPLDAAQHARLMEIAGRCPVHRTLVGQTEIVEVAVSEPFAQPVALLAAATEGEA